MSLAGALAAVTTVAATPSATAAPVPGAAVAAKAAGGTILVSEGFSGTSVPDSRWKPLNDACLTAATAAPPSGQSAVGPCDDSAQQVGPVPPGGTVPGYLQLTSATDFRSGGMLYTEPIPATQGTQFTFDQWQYGGTHADGIGFFLVDGSGTLTTTGADGGSLGYAQRGTIPGIANGYLGVGLDVFGNYPLDLETAGGTKGLGCPADEQSPYPGGIRIPNVIGIRGPGDENTGYCWLTGTIEPGQSVTPPGSGLTPSSEYKSSLPGDLYGTSLADSDRTVRITIEPGDFPTVTVDVNFHDGKGFQQVLSYTMPNKAPKTYMFGFSASTGGAYDVHLIRDVVVRSIQSLDALHLVKQVDNRTKQPRRYAVGDTIPYQYVLTNGSNRPLTDPQVDDPRATDVSCPKVTLAPEGQPGASIVCTGEHLLTSADLSPSCTFTNTAQASANDPAGTDVRSNTDGVTVPAPCGHRPAPKPKPKPGISHHVEASTGFGGEASAVARHQPR
jgi:Bacterial lectin